MAKKKTRKKSASMMRKTKKKVSRGASRIGLSSASWADLQGELQRREEAVAELEMRRAELLGEVEAIDAEIADLGGAPKRKRGRPRKKVGRPAGRRPGRKPGRKPGRPAGRKTAGPGRRTKGKMSLVEALSKVLSGRTLSVTEAADAVKSVGYQTKSANFRTIVNQTLIKYPNLYKKVARGQYTAR